MSIGMQEIFCVLKYEFPEQYLLKNRVNCFEASAKCFMRATILIRRRFWFLW